MKKKKVRDLCSLLVPVLEWDLVLEWLRDLVRVLVQALRMQVMKNRRRSLLLLVHALDLAWVLDLDLVCLRDLVLEWLLVQDLWEPM